VAGALVTALGINSAVMAQSSPVIVDLSVLDDNAMAQPSTPYSAYGSRDTQSGLLMPGATPPQSTYYGPALSNEALSAVKPILSAPVPTPSASLTASDTVAAPEPAPMPEAPSVAALEPVSETQAPDAPEAIALVPQTEAEPPPLPETAAETPPVAASEDKTVSAVQETETASATQGSVSIEPGRAMQVIFTQTDANIPAASENALGKVAEAINANENLRIQLMAFAGGSDLSSSKARRLSLSLALTVRSYFIGQGVRSTRIDVRALGDKTDENPINRVDINITER